MDKISIQELINMEHIDEHFVKNLTSYIDYKEETDSLRKTHLSISPFQNDTLLFAIFHLCLNYGKSLFEVSTQSSLLTVRKGVKISVMNDYYENKKIQRGEFLNKLKQDLQSQSLEELKNGCKNVLFYQYNRSTKSIENFSLEEICENAVSLIRIIDFRYYNIKKCIEEFLKTKNLTYLILGCFLIAYMRNFKMIELILKSKAFLEHKDFMDQLKMKDDYGKN